MRISHFRTDPLQILIIFLLPSDVFIKSIKIYLDLDLKDKVS